MGFFGEADSAVTLLQKLFGFLKNNSGKNQCDDYFYDEFNKKIYIKKNGDGVVLISCILKVIDPLKTDSLVRTLDIEDAKKSSGFEDFESMKAASIDEIFVKYGFWYRSDNDIITDIEEYYDPKDLQKKESKRFISIKLNIDTTRLQAGKTYNLSYAFSVPGLFPIKNGRFDLNEQERNIYKDFRSYISTNHIGHHLRMSAYFEDGIEFRLKPTGYVVKSSAAKRGKDTGINCIYKNNIFYKKYHFEINNPQNYSDIYLMWDIKNPKI